MKSPARYNLPRIASYSEGLKLRAMTLFSKWWDEPASPNSALLMAKQPGISRAAGEFTE